MNNCEDRCVNVPSWSLPISLIVSVSVLAEKLDVSQSSIVREALEKMMDEKYRAIHEDNDMLQCDK